ncbi:hypothetical protein PLICRDRAFT_40631 [Plicaturopsis crispa FD-325 SS-3]|nr:hypothetical protein PLICRDRAFT_40631 [Plicaturopsis crispa FD-325 SS-3]
MLARRLPRLLKPTRLPVLLRGHATAAAAADPAPTPKPDPPKRPEPRLKRFWTTVGITPSPSSISVTLDARPLKTPAGNPLRLPPRKALAAALVASEWERMETVVKPHALPMTSLVSRAIDALQNEATRAQLREELLEYLDTDTICFHQDYPPQLEALQKTHWDPLLAWARTTFAADIQVSQSLLFFAQPGEAKERVAREMEGLDCWELAALERATTTTKSLLIGLALVKRHLSAEQAAQAAQVEVASQIERWGEVEDSHDVDYQDVRRQLGSAACLLSNA